MREIKFRVWYQGEMHNLGGIYEAYFIDGAYLEHSGHNDYEPVFMQYTGFKDCNVVEIYEGDIVISFECQDGFNPLIGKISFGADGKWIIEDSDSKYIEDLCEYADELKVIGNVYESQGLLK